MTGMIETMVEQLAAAQVPFSAWSVEKSKQEKQRAAQEKLLWHELTVLAETALNLGLPAEKIQAAQEWWVGINQFCSLPKTGHDEEVNHKFGAVKALAWGIAKSHHLNKPMVKCIWTACPAYIDATDSVGLPGQYLYPHIRQDKVAALADFLYLSQDADFAQPVELHTPGSVDGASGAFDQCMSPMAKSILVANWDQMMQIVKYLPGLELLPDLSIIRQFLSAKKARSLMKKDKIAQAFKLFNQSNYIEKTYKSFGANTADVFAAFYLGSVVAYGNHKSAFSLSNNNPVKIYFNLEEGDSPLSFSGHRIGVDFRHLLSMQDYHLALMVGGYQVVTPWAGK